MIELQNLSKTFNTADGTVQALKNISLTVNDGDIYGIIGMSGAGKSTLVRCINMLERPTNGRVLIDGVNIGELTQAKLREVRRNVTMIFQSFNLLMQRTCLDNICFPLELAGVSKSKAKQRARELLKTVGLPDKESAYPSRLSGGQQQRIAIARALATNPKILLCDEATSALDPKTTEAILELIQKINKELGITVIIITHQMSVVEKVCNRVAILDDGCVAEEGAVNDVFTMPKSRAAKRLVFSSNNDNAIPEELLKNTIRVIYNGALVAGTPIIAKMAIDSQIEANILYAQTKCIGDKVFGNMILGINGGNEQLENAIEYLQKIPDIIVRREA
ncbi:MAG: ATP-binding cassette domain-containing protein [Firmicutes bacterium]|nr:ATP-binding cassette domain-containing protein [Bacillota bacterium]